jgi:glycosyltransferase involved in cell wall biosynthesis
MVICPAGCGYEEIKLPTDSELFIYKGSHSPVRRCWFETVELPKVVKSYNPDVVFGLGNTGLTNPGLPQALFIQQPYLLYDRRHYPHIPLKAWLRIEALKSQIKKSLPATGTIFCQTPVVKQRFGERFCYPPDKIRIISFPPPEEISLKSDLEKPAVFKGSADNFYVLILTRYLTHRNPSVLIPICRRYDSQIKGGQIKFITTVEPTDHPRAKTFLKEVSRYNLENIIINVGRLSRQDVSRYLSHSQVLWLPTLLETLGLPYLEAMKCRTAIIAPDIDFARYVCGDAAIFYDPWNIESIFNTLLLMRNDVSLRQKLIERGEAELNNREKFVGSWNEVAANIVRELRLLIMYS